MYFRNVFYVKICDLTYIMLLHGDPPHMVSANVANTLY